MRKLLLYVFISIIFSIFMVTGVGASELRIMLNGEYIDAEPVIVDGRTLVSARDIAEILGGNVSWDGDLRQVIIEHIYTNIILTLDSAIAYINEEAIELDVPAQLINSRTKVPLRFITESLGAYIDFVDGTVVITTLQEAMEEGLQLLSITSPIGRSEEAVVVLQGQPYTLYSIIVMYSAPATAAGVTGENEHKISDSDGIVSWSWLVGSRTALQTHYLVVSGDGYNLRVEFEVR
ncbi:MAG: copper amine oxidase N-terminal domain-containing protein [Defluviitaleaceae bacterium]|nr:copper amine oxidase N-terminal domain-containing protein [Defluviitaleaceae bacterium]